MTFSKASRQLREAAGFSQEKLARRIDCTTSAIQNYELHDREPTGILLYSYLLLAVEYKQRDLETFFRQRIRQSIGADVSKPITI